MKTCDVSPDGSTLLCMHGHRIARIDTATGTERDRPAGPSRPAGITWSPDGKTLSTRTVKTERTWTAWDAATGKRLYDLLPTGFVADNEWKMMPDLFFIKGGKELVAGLVKAERNERVGPKELLVFDVVTGNPLRRLGEPLPKDRFQWAIPIAVEPDGSSVVLQVYTVSGPPGMPGGAAAAIDTSREYTFHTTRWDPVQQRVLKEWEVTGHRTDDQRHYAPFSVNLGIDPPDWDTRTRKQAPAAGPGPGLADHPPSAGRGLDRGRLVRRGRAALPHPVAQEAAPGDPRLYPGRIGAIIKKPSVRGFCPAPLQPH